MIKVAVAAVLACAALPTAWSSIAPSKAQLQFRQDLPEDVAAEVATVWEAFDESFGSRLDCAGDAELVLVSEVAGGDARYLVAERRIEIEIPTSPARFRESLAHELAHHLEHACDDFAALRSALAEEYGVDSAEWFVGDRWAETPSERWSETVVEYALGTRVRFAEVEIGAAELELVADWGRSG